MVVRQNLTTTNTRQGFVCFVGIAIAAWDYMDTHQQTGISNDVALPRSGLRTLHLFAGAGGGILADLLLGHIPVCAVEFAAYPRRVLLARQRDGMLPRFPIWDDVLY
jgi:hypothetical protein